MGVLYIVARTKLNITLHEVKRVMCFKSGFINRIDESTLLCVWTVD